MKKIIFGIFILLIANTVFPQGTPGRFCGSDELHLNELSKNAVYKLKWESEMESWKKKDATFKPYYKKNQEAGRLLPSAPITLTVVFHDMTASSSPTTANYNTIVSALNTIYSGQVLSSMIYNSAPYPDKAPGPDTFIRFCLAGRDVNGDPYPVTQSRHNPSVPVLDNTNIGQIQAVVGDSGSPARFPTTKYINIYIVDDIEGSVAGFAFQPSAHGTLVDGIYVEREFLSPLDSQGTNLNYNMNVLAHEMGHYLGLFHVFGICDPATIANLNVAGYNPCSCDNGNCLFNGDMVCDTPPSMLLDTPYSCGSVSNTCNTDVTPGGQTTDIGDDKGNYMDYGNLGCEFHFTDGQIERMQYMIDPITGPRKSLLGQSICVNCDMMASCQFSINSSIAASGNIAVAGNSIAFTPILTDCSAGINYSWSLASVGLTGAVIDVFSGTNYTAPNTLAVGNYQLTLTGTSNTNINCFETAVSSFQIVPAAATCNLSFPTSNSNWGNFGRVSYTGGWTRQNGTFDYTYPSTVRSVDTDSGFDGAGFDIINASGFNDPNFIGSSFTAPAGITSIMRVGHILNNGTPSPPGSAYYVSYTFHVSRDNCKYRIWSLGMREAQNSLNVQFDKFNMNFSPENAAAFGYVCQYKFTSPASGSNPVTVGMGENGTLLQTGSNSWAATFNFGVNDMVSEKQNNPPANFVQSGNFRKMTGWNSTDLDFSEFADLNTDVTVTFFAHSNNALNSLFSAYSYFGVQCLGGGIPADFQMNLPDLSVSCEYSDESCVKVSMPAPAYALNCVQNLGLGTFNGGALGYGSFPFGNITVSRLVGSVWTPISALASLQSCTQTYELQFCLTSADVPYEDFQVTYVTLNKTITQIVRVYAGFYHQTPPCPGDGPYGGLVDPAFHTTNNFLWCPGTPLPTFHATNPCFTQGSYEYLWTYIPNQYISTGVTTPEYTLNADLLHNVCSRTFIRRVKVIDPYCGTPRWVDSEFFNVYNVSGFNFTSLPTANDICLNGDNTDVTVNVSNLLLQASQCIPASLIDTSESTITIQLFTATDQPIGNPHTFDIAHFNEAGAYNYQVDGGIPTALSFSNLGMSGPLFDVGLHYLDLHITSTIAGCTFTKIYGNYVSFRVKEAAIGGTIQLSDTNCTDTLFSITSTDNGNSNGGNYGWEVSDAATGPFFPLVGAGTTASLTNYNFASLFPPVFIRRKSFGIDSCPANAYSNIVQINTSSVITDPLFTFSTSICNGSSPPVFPIISNNGVSGTWSPTTVSTASAGTYTFTPTLNQCANATTITTSIITTASVTFNLLSSYCDNALPSLPVTSVEGIAGTWSPATLTQTGDYIFHPDDGQCAGSDVTVHIEVLPFAIPSFSFPTTYCQGQIPPAFPAISNDNIAGAWFPATINTTATGTFPYIFTATVNGACRYATINITVNPVNTPAFSFEIMVCEGVAAPILPLVSDNNITGSWSPSVVNTASSGDYIFTPSTPCATAVTIHITVTQQCEFTLSWGSDVSCESGNDRIKLDSDIVDGPCLRVCENSAIEYTINGNTSLISNTDWNITGGILSSQSNTSATIEWSNAAFATIQIVIHFNDGSQKTYNICVEKIEAPTALFGILPDIAATEFNTCAELTLFFENLSTSTAGNGTMYYNWDFGDGTTSNEFEPSHVYVHTGTYEVNLIVYNGCSCAGHYSITVNVAKPALQIDCPGVVCENERGQYSINVQERRDCDYQWEVMGGHIVQTSSDHHEVAVAWDHVDDSGFGYVSVLPEGCQNCWSTIKVPIVKLHGTIQGSEKICMKDQFVYYLPQWPSTEFNWALNDNGTGAVLIQNIQRNQIIVQSADSGTIMLTCTYKNTLLGCSGTAQMEITVQPYARLEGPDIVCENTPFDYSFVNPLNSAVVNVNWTVTGPDNFSQAGSSGAFTFSFPTAGVYNFDVSSPDYCSSQYEVIVQQAIAAPTAIAGPLLTCPGTPVAYTCMPQSGAIAHWEVVNGTAAGGVLTGNEIHVNFDPAATTPYVVKVWYEGEHCSSSVLSTVIGRDVPNITLLSGSVTVCGSTPETYTVNNVNAESYNWVISPPTAGSVQSGQNSTSASILWNQAAIPATIIMQVHKCGTMYEFPFPVTIISSPPLSIDIPAAICTENTLDFNFTLTPPAAFDEITVDYGDNTETTLSYANYIANPDLLNHIYNDPIGASTTYTVSATIRGAAGCPFPSHATAQIEVSPSPVITLTPVSGLNLCDLENAATPSTHTYTVDIQGGIGQTYTIEWHKNSGANIISNGPTIDAWALGVGTYWATVTNNYGCVKETTHFDVFSDCGSCTASSPIAAVAVNTSCGTVQATVTIGDPNATSIYWGNTNLPGATIVVSNDNLFVAENVEPGEYDLTINAVTTIDGYSCTTRRYVPFIIPYKAGVKYHVACDNNGLYTVELFDHSVFFPDTPITNYEFTIDNGATWVPGVLSGSIYSHLEHLAPGPYRVGIRISRAGYPACREIIDLVLPAYPDAAFTYDTACAGTATHFTVTHPQADSEYLWTFPFDETTNLQQDPVKTFIGSTDNSFPATLTVTNKYGCSTTSGQLVSTQGVNMEGSISSLPVEACEGSPITLNYDPADNTSSPIQLEWYKDLLTNAPFAVTIPPQGLTVTQSGSYFVHAFDSHGCTYTNADPKTVQFVPIPDAPVLKGTSSICQGSSAHVYVQDNGNMHYSWSLNGVPNPVWNDFHEINQQLLAPGMYTYTVTAQSQASGGTYCPGPSASFTVTVNTMPDAPELAFVVDSCEPYQVTAKVVNVQSGVAYYWSDGDTGPMTTITHDGPLEVRAVLDGCSVTNQIDLPLDLDSVAWIFPTGCFDMCKEETPGYLIGPFGDYDYFSWQEDSNNASSGQDAVNPFYGLGSSTYDYALFLQTEYCEKELASLNMEVNDRCEKCNIKPDIKGIKAMREKDVCWYQIVFSFNNASGANIWATFTAANGEGYFSPGTVLLPPGPSVQLIEFYPSNWFSGGTLPIEIHGTGDKGDCVAEIKPEMPPLCETGRQEDMQGGNAPPEGVFIIAPNPASQESILYYQFADGTGGKTIEIYDFLGRSLLQFTPDKEGSSIIDCSRYAEGSYLIVMKQNGQVMKQLRFLVQQHL